MTNISRKPNPFNESGVTVFIVAHPVSAMVALMHSSDGRSSDLDCPINAYETAASALKAHRQENPESGTAGLFAVRVDLETFKLAEYSQTPKYKRFKILFDGVDGSIMENRFSFDQAGLEWLLKTGDCWLRLVPNSEVDETVARPHSLPQW